MIYNRKNYIKKESENLILMLSFDASSVNVAVSGVV